MSRSEDQPNKGPQPSPPFGGAGVPPLGHTSRGDGACPRRMVTEGAIAMLISSGAVYAGSMHPALIRSRAERRPEREHAGWRASARVEALYRGRTPLVASPGGAQEELYG